MSASEQAVEQHADHPNGWGAYRSDGGVAHVCPLNDLRLHVIDDSCWCGPTDDEGVLVHHSMDRREEYETGRRTN